MVEDSYNIEIKLKLITDPIEVAVFISKCLRNISSFIKNYHYCSNSFHTFFTRIYAYPILRVVS